MSDVQQPSLESPVPTGLSKLYRGPQQPQRVFGVPVPVFFGEILVMFAGFLAFGFYVVALVPLHLLFIVLSDENPFWVQQLWTTLHKRVLASNKGQYGKTAVSYYPLPPDRT